MKFDAENAVLKKLGLDYELLDSGCCGMAGSFGFESEHYDVSVAVGERRAAARRPTNSLIVRPSTDAAMIVDRSGAQSRAPVSIG